MTLTCWKLSSTTLTKYKINILKLIIITLSLYIKPHIESSSPLFYIHHKLKSLRGIKIFALLKIIEFITTLFNRVHKDYELQLLTIITEAKLKRKVISFLILLVTFQLHLVSLWAYITSISIALTDPSNALYALFFKINYIELKKYGKPIKKKNIMSSLTTDIYDRFINYTVFILVIVKNYYENQLSQYNINEYCYKVFFIFVFEIVFDWVKNFIIFKVSYFNTKIVKLITYEIAVYYEKLRTNKINNGNNKGDTMYSRFIHGRDLIIVGKQHRYENYLDVLSEESVICLTLHTNVLVVNVMVISVIIEKLRFTICGGMLIAVILLFIRKIIQLVISETVLRGYKKHKGKFKKEFKLEAEMYVNDPLKEEVNENGINGNNNNVYNNTNTDNNISYNYNTNNVYYNVNNKKERKISLDEINTYKRQRQLNRIENGNPLLSFIDQ